MMLGGYIKGASIRKKINELTHLKTYDNTTINNNKQQLKCMLDLDIITDEQHKAIMKMYERYERANDYDNKEV